MDLMPFSRPRVRLAVALWAGLVAAGAFLPPAAAQLDDVVPPPEITLSAGEFNGTAEPAGGAVMAPVTITYPCGGFSDDITVTATPVAGGTASVEPSSITPATVPDCTPQSEVQAQVNVSVSAPEGALAGTDVPVNVTVSGPRLAGDPTTASIIIGPTVGALLEVTFSLLVQAYEAPADSEVNLTVSVTSGSNDEIMVMPSVDGLPDTPAGWSAAAAPQSVPPPVNGTGGSASFNITITIPAGAVRGAVPLNVTVFAHAVSQPDLETEPQMLPFTVTVVGGGGGDGDGEGKDSPAGAVVPLLVALVAFVALARRRA